MRLLHLARASAARSIERTGLRGRRLMLHDSGERSVAIARGVFAMPVLPDFAITHPWLREPRRAHDERMVAVVFRVPDDETVHVGRYSGPHASMTATEASAWVAREPNFMKKGNAASSIGDDAPEHVLMSLLAEIEFGSRESRPLVLIERFVDHPSEPIRAEARDVRERLGAL